MKYLYVYVENNNIEKVVKYGMKLSEFANKILNISNLQKSGITAYLSPKDASFYFNDNYSCVKVSVDNLNCIIYNQICENTDILNDFMCDVSDYKIGTFEDPVAFIQSTILPENIQIYNKLQDVPLIIENSKQFYYEKSINEMLENDNFSKYELYQLLLILGEQKRVFKTKSSSNIKIYTDKISGKKYTKKSSI